VLLLELLLMLFDCVVANNNADDIATDAFATAVTDSAAQLIHFTVFSKKHVVWRKDEGGGGVGDDGGTSNLSKEYMLSF
jgi:hypothetical protein